MRVLNGRQSCQAYGGPCGIGGNRRFRRVQPEGGRRLSEPADRARHSAAAGRHQRHHGASGLRQDERGARPAHRGRKSQCRRQRHGRHARGRPRSARRLHDHPRLHVDARHRPASLQERRLRSAQGFCADRADRLGAGAALGVQGLAGAQCRRADRADEERERALSGRARPAPAPSTTLLRYCSRNRPA